MTRVVIIGASIGGLVAAATLRERGLDVTLIERSNAIGGLYGKVNTPFGDQELGMHVLYAGTDQFRHLTAIFGSDAFHKLEGQAVDIGGCFNFDRLSLGSIYPDVRPLPSSSIIFDQIVNGAGHAVPTNAREEVVRRFGEEAGNNVFSPILEKLWKTPADELSPMAIHCFFDLRRIIICGKEAADDLKKDPRLDDVVGNPDQSRPSGPVFGGRRGMFFKEMPRTASVEAWLKEKNITIKFNSKVALENKRILVDGVPADEIADGCIVATPITSMAPDIGGKLDQVELSIFYIRLEKTIADEIPAYYILCHSTTMTASRIVNFDSYHPKQGADRESVLAVEVIHATGKVPQPEEIIREVRTVLPQAKIADIYRLPRSLQVAAPSLRNGRTIDSLIFGAEKAFKEQALFFAGMRTDRGVFFSHHTMGVAHDAALECARRLS